MQNAVKIANESQEFPNLATRSAKPGISRDFKVVGKKERRTNDTPVDVQVLDAGYESREDLTGLQILIVDDNRFHRSLIRNALVSQGIHRHWEAEDTMAAEKVLADETIDLIITDNNMPDEKGIPFTERLRKGKTPANAKVPVVMLSAYGDERIIMAARNAGVHEYVLKPFNVVTLLKRIQETFRHPRDFIIAPGYVGPDRRWKEKLAEDAASARKKADEARMPPGLRKPQLVEVTD